MNSRLTRYGIFLLLVLLQLILISGCGGAGGAGNQTSPEVHELVFNNNLSGSVSDAERTAAATAVKNAWKSAFNQPIAAQAKAITDAMQSQAVFRSAGISNGNVWGRYKDGIIHIFTVADPDIVGPQKSVTGLESSVDMNEPDSPVSGMSRAVGDGILPSTNAYVINSMEAARPSPFAKVVPQLVTSGFQVTQLTGSVADWNSVKDCSLLLLHAHGTVVRFESGATVFCLSTSEEVTPQRNLQYESKMGLGEMAICTNRVVGQTDPIDVYGLLSPYSFPTGMFTNTSFAFAMSCLSGQTADLFNSWKKVGLTNLYAWSGSVSSHDSARTCEFFIDRSLGYNTIGKRDAGDPLGFTLPEVFAKMKSRLRGDTNPFGIPDYAYDTSYEYFRGNNPPNPPIVKLKEFGSSNLLSLTPLINDVQFNGSRTSLIIRGHFGPPGGTVLINGDYLTATAWTPTQITVNKPTQTSGTIRVLNTGKPSASGSLKSNSYKWVALSVKLTPASALLSRLGTQAFTLSPTQGTLPTDAVYKWTLTGKGKINGGTTVTTSTPTATYVAPNQDGVFSLKCEVLSASGSVLAEASAAIIIGDQASVAYTISNMNDPRFPNGNYAFTDGVGSFFTPQSGPQVSTLSYNIDSNDVPRVEFELLSARNTPLVVGQSFLHSGMINGGGAGTFSFGLAESMTAPNTNSEFFLIGNDGKLTITGVVNKQNGSQLISFEFTVKNGGTLTASGTGVCLIEPGQF